MTVKTSRFNRALWAGALLLAAGSLLWHWGTSDNVAQAAGFDAGAYSRTYAFVLETGRWCSFRIPPDKTAIKLVSNASVPADLPVGELEYVIRFQAVTAAGTVCMDRTYSLKAAPKHQFCEGTKALLPSHLYGELPLSPLGSKVALVSLRGLADKPDRLQVRLEYAQAPLRDVCIRVYHRNDLPDYKLYSTWRRLSREERENLAKFNVYDEELLRNDEKYNLLRSRWVALAPQGIEGKDFTQRKLYCLEEDGTRMDEEIVPSEGLHVTAHHRGVVPLPPERGRYLWSFRPLEEAAEFSAGATARLVWRGDEERVFPLALSGRETDHSIELEGGIVEVETDGEFVFTVYRMDAAGPTDCTPEEAWVTGYLLEWGGNLTYALHPDEAGGVPFRLDLRRVFFPGDEITVSGPAFLSYRVLDEQGSILAAGDIPHDAAPSVYDMPSGSFADCRVSDPTRHVLWLPPEARTLRLSCHEGNVLVTGYTRPAGLVRHVRVPEDYDPLALDPRRNWFFLRPANAADWHELNRQVLVSVQTRPVRTETEGRLATVPPNERAYARYVLVPLATQDSPSPARFLRLPAEEDLHLFWGEVPGPLTVRPRLLCLRTAAAPEPLTLSVDGDIWHRVVLATDYTDVYLPGIPAGRHTVRVTSPAGASVYVNQAMSVNQSGGNGLEPSLVRTAYLLSDRLSFSVSKEQDETDRLSFRLYLPSDNRERVHLRTELSPRRPRAVPLPDWTYSSVVYDIAPPDEASLPVLFAGTNRAVGERLFFLTLGADLEAGEYTVRLTLESNVPCLVHCGRRVSEHEEAQRIYLEEPVRAAVNREPAPPHGGAPTAP